MSKQTWIIAFALSATIGLVALGFYVFGKQRELQQVKTDLAEAKAALSRIQGETGDLGSKLSASQARIEELLKAKEAAVQTLEQEMRTALESKDVTISQLQGKLTVSILDRILFDSGEAELKPDGADVLRKIAAILAAHTNLMVHVVGHTDNVPIHRRFPSNWELSTARATAAVRFLTEQAGVDPRRLGALGYGEFRPVADNATPEGRAKNRRIAISILSEEMAGADTAPTASTNAAVHLPLVPTPLPGPSVTTNEPPPPAVITNLPPVGPAPAPSSETNNPDPNPPPAGTPKR